MEKVKACGFVVESTGLSTDVVVSGVVGLAAAVGDFV